MMKTTFLCVVAVLAAVLLVSATVWEGVTDVAFEKDLPRAYSIATNSFPRNTVVDVTNLENGKMVRVIVISGLETSGLLATLSRNAADALDLRHDSTCRIRMNQSSDNAPPRARGTPAPQYQLGPIDSSGNALASAEEAAPASRPVATQSTSAANRQTSTQSTSAANKPAPTEPAPTQSVTTANKPAAAEPAPVASTPAPSAAPASRPAPVATAPATAPAPTQSAAPASKPAPVASAPAASQATPAEPAPTAQKSTTTQSASAASKPATAEPAPVASAASKPAATEPAPIASTPATAEPAPIASAPAPVEPVTTASKTVAPEPAPIASSSVTAEPAPRASTPTPVAPAPVSMVMVEEVEDDVIAAEEPAVSDNAIAHNVPIADDPVVTNNVAEEQVLAADVIAIEEPAVTDNAIAASEPTPEPQSEPRIGSGTLTLIPAEERVPSAPPEEATASSKNDAPQVAASKEAPPPVRTAEPTYTSPAEFSPFQAPLISSLERGKWYVQIGVYSRPDNVEDEITRIGTSYPVAIQNIGNDTSPLFRVLLGPLNQGESGAMLQRFKSIGYSDAFVRHN